MFLKEKHGLSEDDTAAQQQRATKEMTCRSNGQGCTFVSVAPRGIVKRPRNGSGTIGQGGARGQGKAARRSRKGSETTKKGSGRVKEKQGLSEDKGGARGQGKAVARAFAPPCRAACGACRRSRRPAAAPRARGGGSEKERRQSNLAARKRIRETPEQTGRRRVGGAFKCPYSCNPYG